MSYIRTKDGVYELTDNMTIENGVYSFFGKIYNTTEKHLFRNDKDLGEFVSKSENLAELCDEFVGIDKTCENGHQFLRAIPYKCANYWNGGVYGAIWTEWGLKYVAKLNSKGELELI